MRREEPGSAVPQARALYFASLTVIVVLCELFLKTLVDHPGPVPAEVLRRAFVVARSAGDENLLAMVARQPQLPDDVDAEIAKLTSAKVRSAWLQRPGRTTEEMADAIRKEKRAGVLAIVAESAAAPAELFEQLVIDGRRSVCLAVLRNESAPLAARQKALLLLAAAYEGLPLGMKQTIRQYALLQPIVAPDQLVPVCAGMLLLELFRSIENPSEVEQLRVVEELVAKGLDAASATHGWDRIVRTRYALNVALEIAEKSSSPVVAEMLQHACSVHLNTADGAALAQALHNIAAGVTTPTDRMADAAESNDPARLEALAQHAVANNDRRLAAQLVLNLHTPEHALINMIELCQTERLVQKACTQHLMGLAQELYRRSISEEQVVELLAEFRMQLVNSAGPTWRLWRALGNERLADLAVEATRTMPISQLVSIPATYALSPAMASALCELLLSAPTEAFHMAVGLERDWSGSLAELMDVLRVVNPQESA